MSVGNSSRGYEHIITHQNTARRFHQYDYGIVEKRFKETSLLSVPALLRYA